MRMHLKKRDSLLESGWWVVGKYIETGTAGQHQSGGPCCGDYCPLWEVGLGGEEEEGGGGEH